MAEETPTLEQIAVKRLARARRWKSLWDLDLREAYFFATPQRQRQIQSYSSPPQQRLLDNAELNTDLAFELCGDFATEVINTYMPEAGIWCERGPGMFVNKDAFDKVKTKVREADEQIFQAIKASNLYAEVSKAFDPDLSIGTVALWIEPPGGRIHEPPVVMAVPIHEMEIDLGPYGEIDTRFAVRWCLNENVEAVVGAEIWGKISGELKKTMADKPGERTSVIWGFWRDWKEYGDVVWQHVVMVGNQNKVIHDARLTGEGSCPMIVFRWNPNPDWPWGHGPILQGMPSLRQVDEMEMNKWEHAEFVIRPAIYYPDDSFAAIEQGIEPGMAYPVRPGTGKDGMGPIWEPPPATDAQYVYEDKEHRLRRLFYVDFPQQTGDTPPTLGQWLDEMARAQRRIGRPGLPFWREGPAQIFVRFKYLLEKAGRIQPIKIDNKAITLLPYNPAQRAAEQQEIAMAVHGLQLCGQFFPEEFKAWVDGEKTMKALLDKLRVELVVFRDQATVNNAVDRISKLLQGTPPGGQVRGPANPMQAQEAAAA